MKPIGFGIFLAGLLAGSPVIQVNEATAATYLITYTGKFAKGIDETGVFFAPNTNLSGRSFSLQYTLTYPGLGIIDANTTTQFALSGGAAVGLGTDLSPLSAVLTVNGISESFVGKLESRFERTNLMAYEGFNEFVEDFSVVGSDKFYRQVKTNFYGNTVGYLNNVDPSIGDFAINFSGYTGTVDAGFSILDQRSIGFTSITTKAASGVFFFDGMTQARVTPTSGGGSSSPVAGVVPEPSSWALMILGFGLVGGALRRQSARRPRTLVVMA